MRHPGSSLALNSNRNLIRSLDLNNLQELQGTEQHVKWHLGECSQPTSDVRDSIDIDFFYRYRLSSTDKLQEERERERGKQKQ